MKADLIFFLVRPDFALFAAIFTALTISEFSSSGEFDPGGRFSSQAYPAGVIENTP